jgi:hypothetical protein
MDWWAEADTRHPGSAFQYTGAPLGGMTLHVSLPPDITNLTEILRTRI